MIIHHSCMTGSTTWASTMHDMHNLTCTSWYSMTCMAMNMPYMTSTAWMMSCLAGEIQMVDFDIKWPHVLRMLFLHFVFPCLYSCSGTCVAWLGEGQSNSCFAWEGCPGCWNFWPMTQMWRTNTLPPFKSSVIWRRLVWVRFLSFSNGGLKWLCGRSMFFLNCLWFQSCFLSIFWQVGLSFVRAHSEKLFHKGSCCTIKDVELNWKVGATVWP